MASSKKNGTKAVKNQGRRVMPALRRTTKKAQVAAKSAQVTLGDLIAAAFDTVGNEVKDVARLLSSREIVQTTGRRIVFVQ